MVVLDVNCMFMHERVERMEVYLVCSCQCNKSWILYLTVNARAPKDGDTGLCMHARAQKERDIWTIHARTSSDGGHGLFMPQSFQNMYTWTVMSEPKRMEVPGFILPEQKRMECYARATKDEST
jgi:hypothetical protein